MLIAVRRPQPEMGFSLTGLIKGVVSAPFQIASTVVHDTVDLGEGVLSTGVGAVTGTVGTVLGGVGSVVGSVAGLGVKTVQAVGAVDRSAVQTAGSILGAAASSVAAAGGGALQAFRPPPAPIVPPPASNLPLFLGGGAALLVLVLLLTSRPKSAAQPRLDDR